MPNGEERLAGRNGAIWRDYCAGRTQEALAEKYGLSQARVSGILSEVRATIPATDIEKIRQRELDYLDQLRVIAHDIITAPPPPAFDQKGNPLIDPETQQVVRDTSAKLAAIDRATKMHERLAKVLGLDAAVKVDHTVTEAARAEAAAAAAEAATRLHGD